MCPEIHTPATRNWVKCVNLTVHIDCSQIEGLNNLFNYLLNLFFPSLYLLNKEAWKVNFVLPNVPS